MTDSTSSVDDGPLSDGQASVPSIRIVLVNDHNILREGMASILADVDDFQVVGKCSTVAEGYSMVEESRPHVVVTDFSMDESNPFELSRRIRQNFVDSYVVFLITNVTDRNLERALMAGASAFLAKSEPLDGVVRAIRLAAVGKKYFSDEVRRRLISRHSYDPNQDVYKPRKALLSPREVEVLCCVARGLKAKSIGKSLQITAKTVERHKSNIMAKLGLHSQVDLAIYAVKEGYVSP